jgi:hypothetical protein
MIKYNIRKILKKNNIKSVYMARKLGISPQLFHYYTKKGDMPVSIATKIADEVGIPIGEMLDKCKYRRL